MIPPGVISVIQRSGGVQMVSTLCGMVSLPMLSTASMPCLLIKLSIIGQTLNYFSNGFFRLK